MSNEFTGERGGAGGGLELGGGVRVPGRALHFQFARSSGPGGQNVNKVNSKAEMWVRVDGIEGLDEFARARLRQIAGKRLTGAGEIHLSCDSSRSQEENRAAVMQRLGVMVGAARQRPRKRHKSRPTQGSRRRRLEAKRRRGDIKNQRREGLPEQ